jgi:hypothetical protein
MRASFARQIAGIGLDLLQADRGYQRRARARAPRRFAAVGRRGAGVEGLDDALVLAAPGEQQHGPSGCALRSACTTRRRPSGRRSGRHHLWRPRSALEAPAAAEASATV